MALDNLQEVSNESNHKKPSGRRPIFAERRSEGPSSYFLEFVLRSDGKEGSFGDILVLYRIENESTFNYASNPHLSIQSVSTKESLGIGREWIRRCLGEHTRCKLYNAHAQSTPTRLIHVKGNAGRLQARVCEGEDRPTNSRYLTLSHCWGSAPIYTLKTTNIVSLTKEIPILKLPQVFQDTFSVAIELGIFYVWIDSLCILQDSKRDWAHESARMTDVYKNAYCNISATAFNDGSSGLFVDRNPSITQPLRVSAATMFQVPNLKGYYCFIDVWLWKREVRDAPLNHRAWVLQERMLSARVLHFGKDQLFWECHEMEASETFPFGLPRIIRFGQHKGDSILCPRYAEQNSSVTEDERFRRFWNDAIATYTRSSLTYSRDKLVAINGIVKEIAALCKDESLAGLWSRHLVHFLPWKEYGFRDNSSVRPPEYRAPSWSWASVDSPVEIPEMDLETCARVKDAYTSHASHDDTGELNGGWLLIQGPLLKAWSWYTATSHNIKPWKYNEMWFFIDGEQVEVEAQLNACNADLPGGYVNRPEVPPTETQRNKGIWIYILVLFHTKVPEKGNIVGDYTSAGLLLLRTEENATFRRVGVFRHGYPGSMTLGDLIGHKRMHKSYEIDSEDYHDCNEDGEYTITIV